MAAGRVVGRRFYVRNALDVAPELLNKLVVVGAGRSVRSGVRSGRIVEVEAYQGPDDPGSHAFGGRTARNATMFGPPGRLYVYLSYGMHWCANVVCEREGVPHAVLIRALAPLRGVEEMRAARSAGRSSGRSAGRAVPVSDRDLCRGPGRLCQALGITGALDGADLVTGDRGVRVVDDGCPPPDPPGISARIGLTKGAEHQWRYFVTGERHISHPR